MELTIPLLLVCGLALLCVVILAVGFFAVRFLWNNFGRVLTEFNRNEQEDEEAQQLVRMPRRRGNLRAKAEAVDFDSALAAASMQQNPDQPGLPPATQNTAPTLPTTQPAPPLDPNPSSPFGDDELLGPRGQQFRDRLRRRDSGEMYDANYGDDERGNRDDEGGLGGIF